MLIYSKDLTEYITKLLIQVPKVTYFIQLCRADFIQSRTWFPFGWGEKKNRKEWGENCLATPRELQERGWEKVSVGERMHSNTGILLSLFLNFRGRFCAGSANPVSVFGVISLASPSKPLTSCCWEQMDWTSELLISLGCPVAESGLCGWEAAYQTQLSPGTRACYHCSVWLPGIPGAASSGHVISSKEGYGPFALAFRAWSAFPGNRPLPVK